MARRFVDVPASAIEALMNTVTKGIANIGGTTRWITRGNERVFEVVLPGSDFRRAFHVYTTLAVGASQARARGQDAVRIVVGTINAKGGLWPTQDSRRILRTAPAGIPPARVAAFLSRLDGAMRDACESAEAIKACECGAPMRLRTGPTGSFYGCTTFPRCRNTRPS